MEASSLIEGYFVGSADRTERLLSCLEFCAVSASERCSTEEVLEKGTFYRGMFSFGADIRLLSQVDTLLDKFSELRLKLLSIPVAIDVSRATIIEANQAWAGLMRRLGKISNRGGVAMHAICNVGDDLVVTSFHPSSIRGSPIRQSLLHVGSDVALYDDSSPRGLSVMLDSLLVSSPESDAGFRVRTCDDKITTSPTASLSASQSPFFSNDESSILSSPTSPVEFTAVLLIDSESIRALAEISSLDQSEIGEFVENVVTLTTEAVRELRKDEKLASIKSMRRLVSTIEALIKLEEAAGSVQNSLSRDRGESTVTGKGVRPPSVHASLEKSFGHVFSVAAEAAANATAVASNGGTESPLPSPKQQERPERKSSSSPVKLLGTSDNSIAASSPAKKSDSPSTRWKSRRYLGTSNSSEEEDEDKPRIGESISGPLNFGSRTDLGTVDALGESWGQYAMKSVVEGSEASSYEDPKSAPSSPPAPVPAPAPAPALVSSPVPASSPVSAAEVAKAVMFEGNSPAKPPSVAAVLAAPPLRWELESRESEDMESFGLRAYHAIRDDILGDVVSRLRDSTLQLSPTRASLAMSQSKDIGSDRASAVQFSPPQQHKAESKSPLSHSPANEFKRKFKAAERTVSSRQSDAYAESKFGAAMAAAAEAVAAARPGTAPAAAKYSDGSGRVALPKPKGKAKASSKGLNTSMDSFRSSVSSLSSMGSPPRPGPASPLRSGGRGSPSLSMSMTSIAASQAERPATGQSRDRPSTGTRRIADARTPSPTKGGASTPLALSQQRLRPTPDASEAFRPNTAASAASRDRGARRGMGYLDVGAYDSPGPSPSGSASFSPNGRLKTQGEGKSPSPLRASKGSSAGGSPPRLESELVIEGWYDEQQEQREEQEEEEEEQEQELDNDPWPRRWETDPSVLPLRMEIPRVRASQDDDLYDEEGDLQEQEHEQEQEKQEVDNEEGQEADDQIYEKDREPEQPALEDKDEDEDGFGRTGSDYQYHRANDEFDDDYEAAEAKAEAEAEAEEVQFVAKSPVSRKARASPASSPLRIVLRASRELPSLDDVPVSVFSTSAINSLKAQLELSRAEIESTRQQKEREVDEARKNTAWHVLRALEGKTVAPSVTFHPAPASPARRGVVFESPTKAVVAPTVATEQPRDEVEAYARGVSLEAQAHEQRRVRFMQQQRSREANVLTQQVLAQAQARDVQQQQRQQQQQQQQTAPPTSQFRARAMANKLSNQQQIKNAICNVCLAGVHHEAQRAEALAAIDYWHLGEGAEARKRELRGAVDTSAPAPAVAQFLVLFFHSKSLSFRGLYAVDPYTGDISKIYGRGPRTLPTACIEGYFKYESSSRSFKKLSVASISPTVDAVAVDPSKFKKGIL